MTKNGADLPFLVAAGDSLALLMVTYIESIGERSMFNAHGMGTHNAIK